MKSGRATIDFLIQLVTIVTMNSEVMRINTATLLFDRLKDFEDFKPHLKTLLQKSIIPRVNDLDRPNIFKVLRGMRYHRLG